MENKDQGKGSGEGEKQNKIASVHRYVSSKKNKPTSASTRISKGHAQHELGQVCRTLNPEEGLGDTLRMT